MKKTHTKEREEESETLKASLLILFDKVCKIKSCARKGKGASKTLNASLSIFSGVVWENSCTTERKVGFETIKVSLLILLIESYKKKVADQGKKNRTPCCRVL